MLNGKAAFKSASRPFPSVLCCFLASRKGLLNDKNAGNLERRKRGEAGAVLLLSASEASPTAAISSLWPTSLRTAPSSMISALWPPFPGAPASSGCLSFWLWQNCLLLPSFQPQGSGSCLLWPASGLLPHFRLASQPFPHLGSEVPLFTSLSDRPLVVAVF